MEIAERDKLRRDLFFAMTDGRSDWFSAQLYRLIAKADSFNKERLRAGFPHHVATWEEWQRADLPIEEWYKPYE